MFRRPIVNVGDRFIKSGTYCADVWVVGKMLDIPADPPHAYLEKEGSKFDSITVSLPALSDPHFFRKA